MTLAAHRTQAPTARKRGGPAQDLQMNASAHGRHPLPEGGEINSLCRAAAGIIPSLPAGSGAHVYPTKGVRGGAEDVHRSATPPTPAAQPVKGYTHPLLILPTYPRVTRTVLDYRLLQRSDIQLRALMPHLSLGNTQLLRSAHFAFQVGQYETNRAPKIRPSRRGIQLSDSTVVDALHVQLHRLEDVDVVLQTSLRERQGLKVSVVALDTASRISSKCEGLCSCSHSHPAGVRSSSSSPPDEKP